MMLRKLYRFDELVSQLMGQFLRLTHQSDEILLSTITVYIQLRILFFEIGCRSDLTLLSLDFVINLLTMYGYVFRGRYAKTNLFTLDAQHRDSDFISYH